MALLSMVGALALGSTKSAEADNAPAQLATTPEFVIGAQEDSVLDEDLEKSQDIAKLIKEAGFNTLKLTLPWTYPTQAEIKNDLKRFQNAAAAARENDLQLMLNLIPGGGSGLGKAPETASQQRRYRDTLIGYMHAFEEVSPGGHIILEIPNEPNSETFWRKQNDKDGGWAAPRAVVNTLAKSYWPVKQEAQKLGIGVTLIGGALASAHDPKGFIEAMGQAKKELAADKNMKGPSFDGFSIHPYGALNNEAPDVPHPEQQVLGLGDYQVLEQSIEKAFGKGQSIWYTEYGVKTKPDKAHLYDVAPTTNKLVSETRQAEFYKKAIRMARCQNVAGMILFNVIDDKDGVWTSGIWYPDKSPKTSYEAVRQAIEEAKNGQVSC